MPVLDGRPGVHDLLPLPQPFRLDFADDPRHDAHSLNRVLPHRRLAAEHDGIPPVEHGVGNVAHLGARGSGTADHRLEHLRGNDDGFPRSVAAGDDHLLQYGDIFGRELHTEIAARYHDTVGGADDLVDVRNCLRLFDLRNYPGAETRREAGRYCSPQIPDIIGGPHK